MKARGGVQTVIIQDFADFLRRPQRPGDCLRYKFSQSLFLPQEFDSFRFNGSRCQLFLY
jgi:hypothetical protein